MIERRDKEQDAFQSGHCRSPFSLEAKAGVQPYQGGFLLPYLDKLVYPDISATVLTGAGVLVRVLNLALYGQQMWIARFRSRRA